MLWFGHRLVVLTNCPTSSLRKSHLVFTSDIHNLKMDGHFTSHAWPTKPWISDDSAWSNPLKKTESITTEKNTVVWPVPLLVYEMIRLRFDAIFSDDHTSSRTITCCCWEPKKTSSYHDLIISLGSKGAG